MSFRYTNCSPTHHAPVAPPRRVSSPIGHYFALRSRPTDRIASSQRHTHGQGEILSSSVPACETLTLCLKFIKFEMKYLSEFLGIAYLKD